MNDSMSEIMANLDSAAYQEFHLQPVEYINANIYLIHGCRTANDCLYLKEINGFRKNETIKHLKICRSREDEPGNVKYVQDYLMKLEELKKLILDKKTSIYVCGDQIKFTKDVFNTFAQVIDQPDAEKLLKEKQKSKQYLEDGYKTIELIINLLYFYI
jgi:sulfite reductase alpha subunit-like flavoprotein